MAFDSYNDSKINVQFELARFSYYEGWQIQVKC